MTVVGTVRGGAGTTLALPGVVDANNTARASSSSNTTNGTKHFKRVLTVYCASRAHHPETRPDQPRPETSHTACRMASASARAASSQGRWVFRYAYKMARAELTTAPTRSRPNNPSKSAAVAPWAP